MRSLQSFRLLSKMENEQFKITKYFFISFFSSFYQNPEMKCDVITTYSAIILIRVFKVPDLETGLNIYNSLWALRCFN